MANELSTPARIATEKFAEHDARLNALMANAPDLVRVGFVNLVENGGFASDVSGWENFGTPSATNMQFSWNASGYMQLDRGSGSIDGRPTTPMSTPIGANIKVSAAHVAGVDVVFSVGSTEGVNNYGQVTGLNGGSTPKTLSFVSLTRFAHLQLWCQNINTSAGVDNIQAWEADPADDAPWLRLPFGYRVLKGSDLHPLASIQRDADMLHGVDFTEIWRNGQCFVKPSTAPGVSTRFSVVAYKGI